MPEFIAVREGTKNNSHVRASYSKMSDFIRYKVTGKPGTWYILETDADGNPKFKKRIMNPAPEKIGSRPWIKG